MNRNLIEQSEFLFLHVLTNIAVLKTESIDVYVADLKSREIMKF